MNNLNEMSLRELNKLLDLHEKKQEKISNNEASADLELIFLAVASNNLDKVKLCVESGLFDINIKDEYNMNLLWYSHIESDIFSYLLSKGADINNISDENLTLLHINCTDGDLDIIKKLIEYGANILIKTDKGTPLDFLDIDLLEDVCEFYVKSNKNMKIKDKYNLMKEFNRQYNRFTIDCSFQWDI